MIKFYTPRNWMRVFDTPSVIIDDDGLIYSETEYYKLSKTACGRVDTKTGYIYGNGHYSGLTAPVGMVKQGPNSIEIYGDDFASIMAVPIYYIQGGNVYTAEEYGKVFGVAAGYAKGNIPTGSQGNQPVASGAAPAGGASAGGGGANAAVKSASILWNVIKVAVIIIGLLALSVFVWNEMYLSGSEYTQIMIANVICLLIGLFAAVCIKAKDTSSFAMIFWVSSILFGLYLAVGMFIEDGFAFKTVLFSVLGMLISALFCLVPALLLSIVVGTVKLIVMELRKRKMQ